MPNPPARRTWGETWRWAQRLFEAAGLTPAPDEGRRLVAHVGGLNELQLLLEESKHIPSEQLIKIEALVARRVAGEPLAYVLGEAPFWGRLWQVVHGDGRVLIPRPDTEILVHEALRRLPANSADTVLEIGCGSGCVLGTLLAERPELQGLGLEIDAAAVVMARFNWARHGVAARADLRQGDALQDSWPGTALAMVVSNPPYVSDAEWAGLEHGVRAFEPRVALTGAAPNADGLHYYAHLIDEAAKKLRPGGWLGLEVGWQQAAAVRKLMQAQKEYQNIEIVKDLAQRERNVWGQKR